MIIQPRGILTPWTSSAPLAPAAPAAPQAEEVATDRATLPAALAPLPAEAPAGRTSLLRSLVFGLSVAASLAGPLAAPALAAPQTALASPVQASSREALVDQMLSTSSHASAADLQKARASLATVPQPVLELLARNGTRITIMAPGQVPSDVGVVRQVDLRSYDDRGLADRARQALRRIDGLYGSRIQALEHRLQTLEDSPTETDEPSAAVVQARTDLERLHQQRDVVARRAVHEATDGRLEPAMTEEAASMGRLARISPVSLRDLAENHDASSEAEVSEFTQLVQRLNGDRIEAAQRAYGVDEHQLSPDRRSMMAYDAQILVPAFKYVHGGAGSTRVYTHDIEADAAWRDNAVRGQYFYRDDINTVLVRADALGRQPDGHDVLLHELGHAYEDARLTLQPQSFPAYLAARDAAFTRIATTPGHPYRGEHAADAPGELGAQTFADAISKHDGALRRADGAWMSAFDAWRSNPH